MNTPTLEQLESIMFSEPYSLIFQACVIVYIANDQFEIYGLDQADDSDPNPIFTGTAQEIITYFENL